MMTWNKYHTLTPQVIAIVQHEGTEPPYPHKPYNNEQEGTFLCRSCGLALFRSTSQFNSPCGWYDFDEEIAGAIERLPDKDGQRTAIRCTRCQAHLGHVFIGEGFTEKNQRHCVNFLALEFVTDPTVADTEEGIFAGGCFCGVQWRFQQQEGVLLTEVGYTGGQTANPSYRQVCTGTTGHFEAVRVIYDPGIIDYEALTQLFFEIHDPTQADGQGPDIGSQYLSAIFYLNDLQKEIAAKLLQSLEKKELKIATQLIPASVFWPAEEYHQNYLDKRDKK